jgi:hypothetical protein
MRRKRGKVLKSRNSLDGSTAANTHQPSSLNQKMLKSQILDASGMTIFKQLESE